MSAFGKLFNDTDLVDGSGAAVSASTLDGTTVVGIYFSAHWCPPCRGFTPNLVATYKSIRAEGKNFQIVFASSDKDESSFSGYFGEMPWLALPFAARELKASLSKKYKVQGIPTLVLLNGNAEVITLEGREAVGNDPRGKRFPWIPPTVAESLGDRFLKADGDLTAADLEGKVVALYFSASWCGPCQQFSPILARAYKALQAAGTAFEVVFVSSDKDEKSFNEYRAKMPWAALPFENRTGKADLSQRFGIEGIPALVVLDGISGKVINDDARGLVMEDPEGAHFPWHPQALGNLAGGADGINENVCVVALLAGLEPEASRTASIDAVRAVADAAYEAARAAGESAPDGLRFFFADKDGELALRLRKLTKIKPGQPVLLVLDIPDDGGYYARPLDAASGAALSEGAVSDFLAQYRAGTLERQQLS